MCAQLNTEQQAIYSRVIKSVESNEQLLCFVSGHGGTGKTFLWNAIVSSLRSNRHVVPTVASCGVASLLLPGGRTTHSRFKIPLEINEQSQCSFGRGTNLAALVARASLIIWDETPMAHRQCFEALDRTLCDILSVDEQFRAGLPFGGKSVLLGGDFRQQVLLVIQGAARSEIIFWIKGNLFHQVNETSPGLYNQFIFGQEKRTTNSTSHPSCKIEMSVPH
jgi:hypothetical protein